MKGTIHSFAGHSCEPPNPKPAPNLPDETVDFTRSILGDLIQYLNHVVGSTGPLNINKWVNMLTENTGALSLGKGSLGPAEFSYSGDSFHLVAGLTNITVGGLNTWSQFEVLAPIQPHVLGTTSSPTRLNDVETSTRTDSLNIFLSFYFNFSSATKNQTLVAEEGKFVLNLANNQLKSSIQVGLNSSSVDKLSLSLDQWLSTPCVVSAMESIYLLQTQVSTLVRSLQVNSRNSTAVASAGLRYSAHFLQD